MGVAVDVGVGVLPVLFIVNQGGPFALSEDGIGVVVFLTDGLGDLLGQPLAGGVEVAWRRRDQEVEVCGFDGEGGHGPVGSFGGGVDGVGDGSADRVWPDGGRVLHAVGGLLKSGRVARVELVGVVVAL